MKPSNVHHLAESEVFSFYFPPKFYRFMMVKSIRKTFMEIHHITSCLVSDEKRSVELHVRLEISSLQCTCALKILNFMLIF